MNRPVVYWVSLALGGDRLDVYAFTSRREAERFAARYGAAVVADEPYATADEAVLDREHAIATFGLGPESMD